MEPTAPVNYRYTAVDLTAEINRYPRLWGMVGDMGIFAERDIPTTYVEVQFRDGQLSILPAEPRGAAGAATGEETDNGIIVRVPHFPHMGNIKPEDLQDRLVFGSNGQQMMSQDVATADELRRLRRNHDITFEWLRVGALKGVMKDGRNRTLYDWYQVFNIVKKTIAIDLTDQALDLMEKFYEVTSHIDDNLLGETSTGVACLMRPEDFQVMTRHPSVEKYYLQHAQALALMGQRADARAFSFGGIDFMTYRGKAPDASGQVQQFIEPNRGHCWPLGTSETFAGHFAPPHHMDWVNRTGAQRIFVSPKTLDHGQGVELKSQSNPVFITRRPELLVELQFTTS